MNKFDSKEFEKNKIEKLKQQQLIKDILNRNQLETQALIKATMENPKKTHEEIVIIKNDILKSEINKQNKKNEEEINQKIQNIKEVEMQIKQDNKEESLKKQERIKLSEKIAKQICEENNTTHLGKKQEKFKQNNRYRKELIEFFNKQKDRKKEKSNKKIKTNKLKEKISKFKLLKGISAYKENIKYYFGEEKLGSNFDKTIGNIKSNNVKNRRENFKTLYQKINHKKAQEDAQKNIKEIHEIRTL